MDRLIYLATGQRDSTSFEAVRTHSGDILIYARKCKQKPCNEYTKEIIQRADKRNRVCMIEWERQDGWSARHPWRMKDDAYREDTTDTELKRPGCLLCNAYQRNDCQDQNHERHTVSQRQTISRSGTQRIGGSDQTQASATTAQRMSIPERHSS